jgi:hypothetical protein
MKKKTSGKGFIKKPKGNLHFSATYLEAGKYLFEN